MERGYEKLSGRRKEEEKRTSEWERERGGKLEDDGGPLRGTERKRSEKESDREITAELFKNSVESTVSALLLVARAAPSPQSPHRM